MNDSLKIGEYYVLIFYRKDFYEYLSYVDIDNDIVRTTFKPERAIRFDNESDAKIFFFNHFERIRDCYWQETDCWSDAHLINVFVAKITTELSSCKPCL